MISPPDATTPVIAVPAEVRRGEPVTIVVYSFGSSSCVQPDGIDVVRTATGVVLTPWDLVSPPATLCTADLAQRPHVARLTFAQAGRVTLTVRGWQVSPGGHRALGTTGVDIDVR